MKNNNFNSKINEEKDNNFTKELAKQINELQKLTKEAREAKESAKKVFFCLKLNQNLNFMRNDNKTNIHEVNMEINKMLDSNYKTNENKNEISSILSKENNSNLVSIRRSNLSQVKIY